jgi:amino acid transporter
MDNNINLNKLWAKQTTKPLETEELFSKFSEIKRKGLKKLITFNIIMIVTIIYIIFIWLYFEPKLITTKVGIGLTLFGIVVYLIVYNQLIPNLNKTNENQSNNEFLKEVIKLKKRHRFLQTRMLQIYFVALTIGISLYLYEYLSILPSPWAIFAYSITLIWVGFNWFYLKPKVVQKERNKYDKIINRFEKLNLQN